MAFLGLVVVVVVVVKVEVAEVRPLLLASRTLLEAKTLLGERAFDGARSNRPQILVQCITCSHVFLLVSPLALATSCPPWLVFLCSWIRLVWFPGLWGWLGGCVWGRRRVAEVAEARLGLGLGVVVREGETDREAGSLITAQRFALVATWEVLIFFVRVVQLVSLILRLSWNSQRRWRSLLVKMRDL